MPDLLLVFAKRWKLVVTITLSATLIALIVALVSPKKYLSIATALPVNSVTADKARIFNSNIEALYSDFGTADELDRMEGTAMLDTIFLAASKELHLNDHYSINDAGEGDYKAAMRLKENSKISRSSYGELKVKVWDKDRNEAAHLANFLMQRLQDLHQYLQNQNNIAVLEKIKQEYAVKQNEYLQLSDSIGKGTDTASDLASAKKQLIKTKLAAVAEQLQQYEKMIGEYQLAISSNAPVLLIVENARPSLWPDKPKILLTVLFTFFASFVFAYLVSLFIESRKI
jgi:uncharacterized protein involved in exopolysaccharide biosynthesis